MFESLFFFFQTKQFNRIQVTSSTAGDLFSPPVWGCVQVGEWWGRASAVRQAAGAGDICDPAQQ